MPKFFPAVLCLRMALAEQMIKTRLLILIAALFREKKTKNKTQKTPQNQLKAKNKPRRKKKGKRKSPIFLKISLNYALISWDLHFPRCLLITSVLNIPILVGFFLHPVGSGQAPTAAPTAAGITGVSFSWPFAILWWISEKFYETADVVWGIFLRSKMNCCNLN